VNQENSVAVLKTGVANVASVMAALRRAGVRPFISDSPETIEFAPRLVLPGVGSFGTAARRLQSLQLVEPLRRRMAAERPTLAICLGMQLLAAASDEDPPCRGLDIFPHRIERLRGLKIPQLGWNQIQPASETRFLSGGFAYFAHSYCLRVCPSDWTASWSNYGGPFVAAIERGPILACQFHPELSSRWGGELLRRWLAASGAKIDEEPIRC
jgi:imidazole glycerol phosphate synthase glutamine amidotransferase subunit